MEITVPYLWSTTILRINTYKKIQCNVTALVCKYSSIWKNLFRLSRRASRRNLSRRSLASSVVSLSEAQQVTPLTKLPLFIWYTRQNLNRCSPASSVVSLSEAQQVTPLTKLPLFICYTRQNLNRRSLANSFVSMWRCRVPTWCSHWNLKIRQRST